MAGIFGDETIRLLREIWPNPTLLAEELFSMFTATEPINIPAGSTVGPPATADTPYLTLPDYNPGQPIFNLTRNGQSVGTIVQNPNGTLGSPGATGGGGGGSAPAPATSNCFPGQVTGGSGNTYTCTVYPKGLGGPSVSVTVTQLQIDPGATIPTGTWALVTLTSDGLYSMQVPVWL